MKTLIDLINSFEGRDKVALKFSNGFRTFFYTYKELSSKTLQYAEYLSQKGVGQGDRVILWAPNSPDWVFAYFAIVALGAVVVPVDFRSNKEHAEKIISSAEPKYKIISKFKKKLIEPDLVLEEIRYLAKDFSALQKMAKPSEKDLVELVYTSGTTGDPKGVMINHTNLLSNIEAVVRRINVSDKDNFLSVLPLSHLFEQTGNMLAPLYIGGTIVYLSTLKPSAIFAALKKENISIFIVVPRLLQGIKKKVRKKISKLSFLIKISSFHPHYVRKVIWFFIHRKFGSSFRFFVSGGAALDPDTEKFWNDLGFRIVQGYGLTECSPILSANSDKEQCSGSVGKALDNVEIILGSGKEILARGPNIFEAYYKNPEKTEASFSNGWFRTGDVGKFDEENNLYIKGRLKDTIVTSAGVNVYPEDIEAVLNEVPGVSESAVIGKKIKNGEEVQAVLILDKKEANVENIISQANQKLEESQWIKSYALWDQAEFPKTSTLKIKKNLIRQAIKEKNVEKSKIKEEDLLIKVISEVLNVRPEEISDEKKLYFNLMLDSIGRVELVTAIEREYNIDFEEENINLQTTVADLRRAIAKQKNNKSKIAKMDWNYTGVIKSIRRFFLALLGNPFIGLWCRVKAEGLENLKNIKGPVIFAPNHTSYFDQASLLIALPEKFRRNVATAAWDEYFRPGKKNVFNYILKRSLFYVCAIGWGAFGFSQSVNHKKSMEYIGKLVDKGNHIILFPEGERTQDGEMLPLKPGIDILVRSLEIPVVPVGIIGLRELYPRGQTWPKRGKVTIKFGEPIYPSEFQGKNVMLYLGGEIRNLKREA